MAEVRTLKEGELYVVDGSSVAIGSDTGTSNPVGFRASDGTYVLLFVDGGDVKRITGNSFLTLDTGAGAAVINAAQDIDGLAVCVNGSNVHLWYGYDSAGGSAFEVYYTVSTDAGATWSAGGEVISLGTGGSWNDVSVKPCGAHWDATDSKVYLHCIGYDGATPTIGQWSIDTGDDFTSSGNYDANAANPVFASSVGIAATVGHANGVYHLYAAVTLQAVQHAASVDGVEWDRKHLTGAPSVFERGISGQDDDALLYPSGCYFDQRNIWLFYAAQDGSTNRNFIAVGDPGRVLSKVPGINTLTTTERQRVYYATGDLSWQELPLAMHVPERNKPGALINAPFTPFGGSFGFRLGDIGTGGVGTGTGVGSPDESAKLFAKLLLASPSVNEGTAFAVNLDNCHLLYRLTDSSGTVEQYVLFPRVHAGFDFSEAEDGNMLNVAFTTYGTRQPIRGRY